MLALCTTLAAQDVNPEETARFRFGPIRFTPSIALTNLGVDDNVFNEDLNPKRDTTAAVGPAVELWVHVGPTRLSGKAMGQYLYFDRYDNQRSWNTADSFRWAFPMARVTPFLLGTLSNTKERAGFEIDSRARSRGVTYGVGTDVRLSGRTNLIVTAQRGRTEYDDSLFLGVALADALDRKSDEGQVQLRFRLTPLTTFVVDSRVTTDRFTRDPLRDADSIKVMPGFEFKPFALISGSAFVGYRRFAPISHAVPDYTGLVSTVNAGYVFRAATRVEARVVRDITYSYSQAQPYYRLNDVGLTVTWRFTRSWEVALRGGRQSLAYANLAGSTATDSRVDHGGQYGGGIGYYLGDTLRLGFDVSHSVRRSPTFSVHEYQAVKFGASVTYGVPR